MLIVILSAIVSGIAGGMGIGGGSLLIPALVFFSEISQHVAQSTNLIFFIPTAISALIIHIKNKGTLLGTFIFYGELLGIRTPDPLIKSQMLCQLS